MKALRYPQKTTPRPLRTLEKKQRGSRGTPNHPEEHCWRRMNRAVLVSLSNLQLARKPQKQTKRLRKPKGTHRDSKD